MGSLARRGGDGYHGLKRMRSDDTAGREHERATWRGEDVKR